MQRQRQHLGGICGSLEKTQKEQDKSRRAVGLCTRSVCVRNRNKSEVLEYKPGCLWVLTTHEEDAASVSLRTLGRITGSPLGCKQNHLGVGTFKNNWCVGHPKSLLHCLGIRFLKSPWKWKCQSLSHVQLFGTPWTVVHQAPLSMGFSKQEYWSGLPFPSPGIFLAQGSNPGLLSLAHWSNKRCPLDRDWFCRLPLRVTLAKSTYNDWPMQRKRGTERFLRIMTEPQDHKDTSRRHDIPQVRCHLPSYKNLILTSC